MKLEVQRALLSVYDKTGLIDLASGLVEAGVEIVSSGGTAEMLQGAGIAVTPVSEVTGAPEILGGRVKTLHPKIHGGILARSGNPSDQRDLTENGIAAFQLVVVNLYPFRETLKDEDADDAALVEMIDIGGPAMVRAAAKNHAHVAVATRPDQYQAILEAIRDGGIDDALRSDLAATAFFMTSSYDAAIAGWLGRGMILPLKPYAALRYGENPHQKATLLVEDGVSPWWAIARQYQGKEMSFNNYADADAAWRLASDTPVVSVAVVKHTNPAGFAHGSDMAETFLKAWDCDPMSAFGSVIGCHGQIDTSTAELIAERFIEVVICSSITPNALEILGSKKNLRVLEAPPPDPGGLDMRYLGGGFLVQDRDSDFGEVWEIVSERQPTEDEMLQLSTAMKVAMHTKSNAIVIFKDFAAVGVGAGDQSRVGAGRRAVAQAGERARGAVAASDAFFPFRDGVDTLAEAGVTAVVEPGGSRNDQEIIDAANEHGMALVFSQNRHFKH
ncbi:MAG: bifunctional phosphoribosylaminoimidazolecarboxamide formyltransferase/IMP cyclohydrolase [Acidimicrobiia bacterium]|nr:bifunctional phosphoribosylaminoimidazolecarboxamide formyltransferase/IMP cyclohydrolase [Acidimicrobiia bacterium]MDH3462134.1 bifunctional phosphoribosylaminoimidazolecarboxamide formyltransferase/IMP cyclohydrolase [Acidimicrobiia bacterium]